MDYKNIRLFHSPFDLTPQPLSKGEGSLTLKTRKYILLAFSKLATVYI